MKQKYIQNNFISCITNIQRMLNKDNKINEKMYNKE